jgi:putative Holliday junction resolvase
MGRLMAIDFGMKRCGVAVSDPLKMIATPLKTVNTKEFHLFLQEYLASEEVEHIVVGEPLHLDGKPALLHPNVLLFLDYIKDKFGTSVSLLDERYTSKMAAQAMIDGGMKKKERQIKGNTDLISAVLILQSYMNKIEHTPL